MRVAVTGLFVVAMFGGCGGKETPADPAAQLTMASLAKELEVELTPFEEFERHRGGEDAPALQLLYPREDMRAEDLDTFRVDVSSEFEAGGKIEFRRGTEVLFSRDFAPEDFTTSEAIPEAVRTVKPGQTVTWGYYPEKGRDVTAQFTIVKEDPRLRERVAKAKERSGGIPYLETAMRAQLYLNARLYYAAYREGQRALEHGAEDATQAYAVVQASLRAMKLHKTALWTDLQAHFDGVRGRYAR